MEARRTAAAAVLADFQREDDAFAGARMPVPDYWTRAARLASVLASLLEQLAAEPEPDPDLEEWLRRQVQRARSRPSGAADLATIRELAALEDGTVAETVARWLRETREAIR